MITIINDSRDENAKGRQIARAHRFFKEPTSFIGVKDDLEASGNLVDVLDAYAETSGVILVNVAPRNGKAKQWENGTPFGYFWYGETLVVSTIDGYTLSLIKKLRVTSEIHVLNYHASLQICENHNLISTDERAEIENTQFRSLRYSPLMAYALWNDIELDTETWDIHEIIDIPECIWWIDNFGNSKTTLLDSEFITIEGQTYSAWGLSFPMYRYLKDVPDNQEAFIVGSSGLKDQRFLEFVGQGFNVASSYAITTGDTLSSEFNGS